MVEYLLDFVGVEFEWENIMVSDGGNSLVGVGKILICIFGLVVWVSVCNVEGL